MFLTMMQQNPGNTYKALLLKKEQLNQKELLKTVRIKQNTTIFFMTIHG